MASDPQWERLRADDTWNAWYLECMVCGMLGTWNVCCMVPGRHVPYNGEQVGPQHLQR